MVVLNVASHTLALLACDRPRNDWEMVLNVCLFIFTPGEMVQFDEYDSSGLKPPTGNTIVHFVKIVHVWSYMYWFILGTCFWSCKRIWDKHVHIHQYIQQTCKYQIPASISLHPTLIPSFTPLKINMEPKNQPIEKEHHIPNLHFWVPC